jgi:AcrR family transcriptional regulator
VSGRPAQTGRREQTKQANRAAILVAGRAVFAELGYGAASVRDIVRRTDLASGTFYNYFPDKESVLRALLEETAEEARTRVRSARRNAVTPEEFVREGFRAYFSYLLEDPSTFELLRRNAGTVRAMYDDVSLVAGVDELAQDLRDGIAGGVIAPHDVEYMASAMVGAGLEVGIRLIERGEAGLEEAVDFITALFAAGLRGVGTAAR